MANKPIFLSLIRLRCFLKKISNYLKKNNSDYLFVSAPENVAWILNIRGRDGPNTPMPNSRLIISKTKKILLIGKIQKSKTLCTFMRL